MELFDKNGCLTDEGLQALQAGGLDELGRLSVPQLTKDAVSGRIRRLLLQADRKANAEGLPDTQAETTARCSA